MPGAGGPRGTGWSAADDQLLTAVREAVIETHELLGAVGRDVRGLPALLAREQATGELVVLLLDGDGERDGATADFALVERRELDENVPAPERGCPTCKAPQAGWARRCAVCGSEIDGAQFADGTTGAELLGTVRRSTSGAMEVVGVMQHADGGGPVFFARDRGTGAMVAMTLAGRTVDATGRPDITLGVTPLPILGAARSVASDVAPAHPVSTPTPSPGIATISLKHEALAAAAQPVSGGEKVCPQCGTEYPAGVRFCARDGAALRARARSDDLVGQIVADKYSVLRRLGVGGMGEVYLAEHVHMGRQCALKVMRRELTNDPDAAGRFRREAASASRINHPSIATVYDFGETAEGIAYIVMEYVDGEPLSAILEREKKLDPARAVTIAGQIAEALGAAHELGIVHRDLKPDNVMIVHSRGVETVKVVDFGIAKAIQGGSRQLTRTGYVLGTPAYMSPEQIMGGELDGRSDQYNLACIMYEMLTGQVTFAGPTGEIVIHRRLTEPPPHPRKLEPAVPRALDAAVAHALARTPEERFPTAVEFGRAMAEAIASRGSGWSPFAWLGRGRSAPATAAPTHATATPPHTPAPALPSAGITAPRIRPPTGASTTSAMRVAPPPEPPTSPPVARPKWPRSGAEAGSETSGSISTPGTSGTSGTRTPAPDGAYGTQPSSESPGIAVTGERTGEQWGERPFISAAAHAPATSREGSVAQGSFSVAPGKRPARALGRLAAAATIVVAGSVGATVLLTRSAPAPDAQVDARVDAQVDARVDAQVDARTAVAADPSAVSGTPGTPGAPIARAATDSAGTTEPAAGAQQSAESTTVAPGAASGEQPRSVELEAQLTKQAGLARAARARAVAAGAQASTLDEGDSLLQSSRAWQARGNYTNALRDGLEASQSWALAERAALAEARQSAERSSATAITPGTGAPHATGPAREAASVKDSAAAAPVTRAITSEAATAAAAGVLRSYVGALSKRDLATMRKLWPTMPDNTASGFQNLFKLATNFSASLAGEPKPRIDGADADAELRYSLDYFLPSQGAQKQSFRLHAVMRSDGGGWTIRSLEPIR